MLQVTITQLGVAEYFNLVYVDFVRSLKMIIAFSSSMEVDRVLVHP